MMQIAVNGEAKQVKEDLPLSELITELSITQTAGLALAVNDSRSRTSEMGGVCPCPK